jgi:hypothetical protein
MMLSLVSTLSVALMTLVIAAVKHLGAQTRHCNGSVIFRTPRATDVERSFERPAAGKVSA